jgi:hypothetical protein
MNRRSVHITIPSPCHESWDSMDATARGAFCHSCQKEVIDFSAMTDREVIEYLSTQSIGCGKFREDQLNTKLSMPQLDNGIFRWKALLLGFLSFISFKDLSGQSNNKPRTNFISSTKAAKSPNIRIQKEVKPIALNEVIVTTIKQPLPERSFLGSMVIAGEGVYQPIDALMPDTTPKRIQTRIDPSK